MWTDRGEGTGLVIRWQARIGLIPGVAARGLRNQGHFSLSREQDKEGERRLRSTSSTDRHRLGASREPTTDRRRSLVRTRHAGRQGGATSRRGAAEFWGNRVSLSCQVSISANLAASRSQGGVAHSQQHFFTHTNPRRAYFPFGAKCRSRPASREADSGSVLVRRGHPRSG